MPTPMKEMNQTYISFIASTTYLRESHVDEIEPALQSFGDHHPASARWTHGCQYMHVLIFKQDVYGSILNSNSPLTKHY